MTVVAGPVSLYVHIPFCTSKCLYCSFYSEPVSRHDTKRFVNALIAELDTYQFDGPVRTIYIGGGSPSCLGGKLLCSLVKKIVSRCNTPAEFTVEANPGQVDYKMLKKLRKLKVNRLSLGAQSFNQQELDILGRTHTPDDTEQAVIAARKAGFENISLDLIFAIPGQREDFWMRSLRSAFYLGPQHISAYSLTYEPATPLYEDCQAGKIKPVSEEDDLKQYEYAIDELAVAGFEQYEISNFARGGFTCRHNMTYWQNSTYVGIGPSAASFYNETRTQNVSSIAEYIRAIEDNRLPVAQSQTLSALEIACETAVLNLRRIEGIDLEDFAERTDYDLENLFPRSIDRLYCQGLIEVSNGRLSLSRKALPIADTVLTDFSSPD